uniref:Putative secreted protein n=1 Tax=Anopheles darlingi TaxID=43151 RepID=A0A2M4DI82_ANODA
MHSLHARLCMRVMLWFCCFVLLLLSAFILRPSLRSYTSILQLALLELQSYFLRYVDVSFCTRSTTHHHSKHFSESTVLLHTRILSSALPQRAASSLLYLSLFAATTVDCSQTLSRTLLYCRKGGRGRGRGRGGVHVPVMENVGSLTKWHLSMSTQSNGEPYVLSVHSSLYVQAVVPCGEKAIIMQGHHNYCSQ